MLVSLRNARQQCFDSSTTKTPKVTTTSTKLSPTEPNKHFLSYTSSFMSVYVCVFVCLIPQDLSDPAMDSWSQWYPSGESLELILYIHFDLWVMLWSLTTHTTSLYSGRIVPAHSSMIIYTKHSWQEEYILACQVTDDDASVCLCLFCIRKEPQIIYNIQN